MDESVDDTRDLFHCNDYVLDSFIDDATIEESTILERNKTKKGMILFLRRVNGLMQ